MDIKLYKNNSSINTLNKSLTCLANYTCQITDVFDIYNPTFIISVRVPIDGDYIYCSDTKYYYYITDLKIEGNLIYIYCECDYLMSFKSQIMSSMCIAVRSSSHYNPNIKDSLIADDNSTNYNFLKFNYSFLQSKDNIIMQIGGARNA